MDFGEADRIERSIIRRGREGQQYYYTYVRIE
jgi:hypothetical protein